MTTFLKSVLLAPFKLVALICRATSEALFPPIKIAKVLRQSMDEALLKAATHTAHAEQAAAEALQHRTSARMYAKRAERLQDEIDAAEAKSHSLMYHTKGY